MDTAVDSLGSRPSTAAGISVWPGIFEFWHLLSLDAPTVAALWSWFLARAMHLELPWHAPLLLALGTWLVYVADRILDGVPASPSTPLRDRHHFHARHRKAFLSGGSLVGCVVLWLIAARMSSNARYEDTVLFSSALLYLVLVHKPRPGGTVWLPKELLVGIVFASATAVPAWSRIGPARITLFPALAGFAALCWLNCVAIERWENRPATVELLSAGAHPTTRWIAQHFRKTALLLAAVAEATAGISLTPLSAGHKETALVWQAIATSAFALALIDHLQERLSQLHLRVSADLALLTPLLFLPLLR